MGTSASMSNSNPKVSIIVPAYNAEDYIGETIQSVLEQSYENWELLLVDDGSTDRTKEVIQKYLNDPRIKYFYKKNGGQGSARNLGIKKAGGEYLAFLDADDLWDVDKLKTQVKVLSEKKDIVLVFSRLRRIDHKGNYLNRDLGSGTGVYRGFRALFLLAAGTITIPNSSVIATREDVVRVGCYSEKDEVRNMEDYDLWFRMLMAGCRFYGIGETKGAYRIHEGQSTYSSPGASLKLIAHLENMCEEYPEKSRYFKYLIIRRLSSYFRLHGKTAEAGDTCIATYLSSSCIKTHWVERYFIRMIGLTRYLRLRGLLIRRFRRFKHFVASINS
ncbi:Glycosyltransferase involved in cell wall bisynthesis [Fodinibius roseus]|uniref:Glycosyltransferase involved in cell wall bisynthesis n=1 Tax=Fodinibius roseus TaxID=1194090 RepID=A0A1M4SMW3_9BACT|nr:glycosyltransferase family 2 protein [Fodinibius roseus]SHE33560.1 Glycosyltransferase involved in cell wall bisynthesis [Fodinibius roseus]